MTRLQDGWLWNCNVITSRCKRFLSFAKHPAVRPTEPFVHCVSGVVLPDVKQSGHKAHPLQRHSQKWVELYSCIHSLLCLHGSKETSLHCFRYIL